jgi:thiol-disulfide isomerase/thioredoxin
MRRIASFFAPLAISSFFLCSTRVSADDPDPIDLLKQADEAARTAIEVAYQAKVTVEGRPDARGAVIEGSILAKANAGSQLPKLKIEGSVKSPDGNARRFHVITDGEGVLSLDHEAKTATRGKLPEAQALVGLALALWMVEYFHATPFGDEIGSDLTRYEGTKEVNGVECDVVYVVYAQKQGRSRWYFGRRDHLPRRVDRFLETEGEAARVLSLSDVNPKPGLDAAAFALKTPAGYEEKEYKAPQRQPRPELLAAGTTAPSWSLKTPDGSTVSLDYLRGKVVVLDFWATWCGPCRQAMPGIQKLHQKLHGKPVAIYGVNCWERGDPAAFMKSNNYTYGLLLGGDKVAEEYRVSGIPTFYIIGPDGKVVHAASGFRPDLEAALETIIADALPAKAEGETPAGAPRRVRI